MRKNQFVVRHGNRWAVVGANNSRPTAITDTQRASISIAKRIAQNEHSEMRVQGRDGRFRTCNSYGNDNCPPKDRNL